MKNIKILLILLLYFVGVKSFSQEQINVMTITPVVFNDTDVSDEVRELLKGKMLQVASKYGFASGVIKNRHIIYPDILILSKDVVAGAPPKVMMNLQITFYIADYDTKTIFASEIFDVKGVGENDTKAYYFALKNLSPSDRRFANLMKTGKAKIVAYYDENCGLIIKDAVNLADKKQYEEALDVLARIPFDCKDCYTRATESSKIIFLKYDEQKCRENLAAARGAWISRQSYEGALATEEYFAKILPGSPCYGDAQALQQEIKAKIEQLDKRKWDFQLKKAETEAEAEKARLEAIKEINSGYQKQQAQQFDQQQYYKSDRLIIIK